MGKLKVPGKVLELGSLKKGIRGCPKSLLCFRELWRVPKGHFELQGKFGGNLKLP